MKHFLVFCINILQISLFGQSPLSTSYYNHSWLLASKDRSPWAKNNQISAKVIETEEGRDILFSPGFEVWYSHWKSFNYIGDVSIRPAWVYCPSLGLKIGNFDFNFNLRTGRNIQNIPGGVIALKEPTIKIIESGLKFNLYKKSNDKYTEKKSLFTSEILYGKYSGESSWDSYKDTINFERDTTVFPIDSRMFYMDFFPESGLVGESLVRIFGIRLAHYNAPASVYGREIPDPRDPSRNLIWQEIANTKFNHLFIVLNSGRLFELLAEGIPRKDKKVRISFDGHWYTLFLGLGWGNNKPMGRFFSYSSPQLSSQIGGLVLNMEFDFAAKLTMKFNKNRDFACKLGVRWTDWELVSSKKKDLTARSKDRYIGPYIKLLSHI